MPLIGVSIEKETLFHGKQERFSNQYYYNCGDAFQDADAVGLISYVSAREKEVHSSEVVFRLGRAWTAGRTKELNEQIALIDLSGQGQLPALQRMAAECAVLVEWECARKDIRGRKVYLRKFIRAQHLGVNQDNMAMQRIALDAAAKTPFKAYADAIESHIVGVDVLCALVSESLNAPRGAGNGAVDSFVRTREFRRN